MKNQVPSLRAGTLLNDLFSSIEILQMSFSLTRFAPVAITAMVRLQRPMGFMTKNEGFQKLFTTYAPLTLLLSHNTEQKFQLQMMSKS